MAKEELNLSGLLADCLNDFKKPFPPDRIFMNRTNRTRDVKGDPLLYR